jgi:dihydrofolate synthase/folylpolyglutamate synthase
LPPTPQPAEIEWLYGLQHFGIKLGLDNIRALLDLLGHPETAFRSVHVAGTNGKGSVAAMVHAILGAAGIEAGLFTSPHLVRPNERIRLGHGEIETAELCQRLAAMRARVERGLAGGTLASHPSFFEVITATALEAFRDRGLRVAVLEVGLGGRLDATNAVDADVAVVVSIDLDHTRTLGATPERIAAEKAGIVKPGRPVVSGVVRQSALAVLRRTCAERGAPLVDANLHARFAREDGESFTLETPHATYSDLRPSLAGRHQIHNARVAVTACEVLARHAGFDLTVDAVRAGLAAVRWPGRLQWLRDGSGALLLDGAHNPAGMQTLVAYLARLEGPPPVALFGAMQGKLLEPMLRALAPRLEGLVLARPPVQRAEEPAEVAAVARRFVRRVEIVPDPGAALERARRMAGADRFVLVTGSLYLVGEVLARLTEKGAPGPVST